MAKARWARIAVVVSLLAVAAAASAAPGRLYHDDSIYLHPPYGYSDRNSTLFGYSMLFKKLSKGLRLLVGAPIASNIGKVFECDLSAVVAARFSAPMNRTACREIQLPQLSVNRFHVYLEWVDNNQPPQTMSDYYNHDLWLGATLAAAAGDAFVSCAPRWSDVFDRKYQIQGACYEANVNDNIISNITSPLAPTCSCLNTDYIGGYGWSLGMQNNILYMGGPAVCTTGAYMKHLMPTLDQSSDVRKYGFDFFPVKCPGPSNKPAISTMNFGYAMAFGKFVPSHRNYQIATSSLYGKHGRGEVVIIIDDQLVKRIKVSRVGSMFGAAVCAVRVHNTSDEQGGGKGYMDLLVGAPLYTDSVESHEQGAVFLYLGGPHLGDEAPRATIYGDKNKPRSYFGHAIANLGDLDGDSFEEFAVGAPYEDDVGAVYVYGMPVHKSGAIEYTYRQRLSPRIRGFGASIVPLPDVDYNGCNEMAVGADVDSQVAVFRCPRIVTVTRMAFIPRVQLWMLDVNAKRFEFESCVEFRRAPSVAIGKIKVTTILVGGGASLDDNSYEIVLQPHTRKNCRKFTAKTEHPISDRMNVTMTVTMVNDCFKKRYDKSCAVLGAGSVLRHHEMLSTRRGCGVECKPKLELKLRAAGPTRIELGTTTTVTVQLIVHNSAESAYEWCATLQAVGAPSRTPDDCERDSAHHLYSCKYIPLFGGTAKTFELIVQVDNFTSENTSLLVKAELEKKCGSNQKKSEFLKFEFFALTKCISIKAASEFAYEELTERKNKTFSHVYWIENSGPTTWENVVLEIAPQRYNYLQHETPLEVSRCKRETETSESNITIRCSLPKIMPHSKFYITISLTIIYDKVGNELEEAVNITSSVRLLHTLFTGDGNKKSTQSTTVVVLNVTAIKWWYVALAVLFALLLLGAIAFGLYRSGFFKREAKKNLQELKRKSAIYESMRAPQQPPAAKQN